MRHVTYELETDIKISHMWHKNDSFLGHFQTHMWRDSFWCHDESHSIWSDVRMSDITYEVEVKIKSVTCDIQMTHSSRWITFDMKWRKNEWRHIWIGKWHTNQSHVTYKWRILHDESHQKWSDIRMSDFTYEVESDIQISHMWHTNDAFFTMNHVSYEVT